MNRIDSTFRNVVSSMLYEQPLPSNPYAWGVPLLMTAHYDLECRRGLLGAHQHQRERERHEPRRVSRPGTVPSVFSVDAMYRSNAGAKLFGARQVLGGICPSKVAEIFDMLLWVRMKPQHRVDGISMSLAMIGMAVHLGSVLDTLSEVELLETHIFRDYSRKANAKLLDFAEGVVRHACDLHRDMPPTDHLVGLAIDGITWSQDRIEGDRSRCLEDTIKALQLGHEVSVRFYVWVDWRYVPIRKYMAFLSVPTSNLPETWITDRLHFGNCVFLSEKAASIFAKACGELGLEMMDTPESISLLNEDAFQGGVVTSALAVSVEYACGISDATLIDCARMIATGPAGRLAQLALMVTVVKDQMLRLNKKMALLQPGKTDKDGKAKLHKSTRKKKDTAQLQLSGEGALRDRISVMARAAAICLNALLRQTEVMCPAWLATTVLKNAERTLLVFVIVCAFDNSILN